MEMSQLVSKGSPREREILEEAQKAHGWAEAMKNGEVPITDRWFRSWVRWENLSRADTSQITDMSRLFIVAPGYDISGWDVSNVRNMAGMFLSCTGKHRGSLERQDLSKWDVRNVQDMSKMFMGVELPPTIGISKWDVSNVQNMAGMFMFATIHSGVDLSKWDVRNVRNIEGIFNDANVPRGFNISEWNIQNVASQEGIFRGLRVVNGL